MEIGVIGDTHGLLRPEALEALEEVDRILHTGDVGDPGILAELEALAPVQAVWGNVDGWDVREHAAEVVETEADGVRIAMIHGHQLRDHDRLAERYPDARVVLHGHTHLPKARWISSTLVLNPGSAGPRRAGKPVTLAFLRIRSGEVEARHLDLLEGGPWRRARG